MELDSFVSALAGGGVTAVMLGIAGYLGRSQLAHWLNKDIEKIKASYQRELEAYKVSLIAEAERAKAAQSVKTAGAVKVMERKFDALIELSASVRELASKAVTHCGLNFPTTELFIEEYKGMQARIWRAADAIEAAAAFIPSADYMGLLKLNQVVIQNVGKTLDIKGRLPPEELATFQSTVLPMQSQVNNKLQGYISALMNMGD